MIRISSFHFKSLSKHFRPNLIFSPPQKNILRQNLLFYFSQKDYSTSGSNVQHRFCFLHYLLNSAQNKHSILSRKTKKSTHEALGTYRKKLGIFKFQVQVNFKIFKKGNASDVCPDLEFFKSKKNCQFLRGLIRLQEIQEILFTMIDYKHLKIVFQKIFEAPILFYEERNHFPIGWLFSVEIEPFPSSLKKKWTKNLTTMLQKFWLFFFLQNWKDQSSINS